MDYTLYSNPLASPNPVTKDPAVMPAAQLNRELDRLDALNGKLTDEFIQAGRGSERASETLAKDDPLARRYIAIWSRRKDLQHEIERRYGPGAPSRLPRGFRPLKQNPACADSPIARRRTSDGYTVLVWADGTITDQVGQGFTRHRLELAAALVVAGELSLFTAAELPELIRAASKLARRGNLTPGAVRALASRGTVRSR